MKVGVLLPLGEEPYFSSTPSHAEIRRFALQAEEVGLDSVWFVDHLVYRLGGGTTGVQECWTTAAAVAVATSRVELGTLVVATEFRNPALLAKMAASVDELSDGRLTLGLGAGWHDPEYEAFGYPTDHKVGRFEESLQIIRGLLHDGEPVTFDGRYHSVADCVLVPPPGRRIPILVASFRPRMLELTARHADGWNTAWYGAPDEGLATARADLQAACERVGRTEPLTITVGIHVHYPDLHPTLEGRDPLTGGPDEIAAGLATHAAQGAEHVVAWLVPQTAEALARFAEGVARFRAA